MKTYKYKIAHFTPDRILIWSKEHTIKALTIEEAFYNMATVHNESGYLLNVDYELVYLSEVQDESLQRS